MFGYLQTVFALVQLAGGPLFGRFGDLFGGRAAMTLAFLSASATYLLLSLSTSVPLLFLSRLMSVFLHAMQGKIPRGGWGGGFSQFFLLHIGLTLAPRLIFSLQCHFTSTGP